MGLNHNRNCSNTVVAGKPSQNSKIHISEWEKETLYPAIMRSQATHELACILFKVNQIYRRTFVWQNSLKTVQTSVELFASCLKKKQTKTEGVDEHLELE